MSFIAAIFVGAIAVGLSWLITKGVFWSLESDTVTFTPKEKAWVYFIMYQGSIVVTVLVLVKHLTNSR